MVFIIFGNFMVVGDHIVPLERLVAPFAQQRLLNHVAPRESTGVGTFL